MRDAKTPRGRLRPAGGRMWMDFRADVQRDCQICDRKYQKKEESHDADGPLRREEAAK